MKPNDQYYLQQPEPNRSCLLALRDLILTQDDGITETIKWSSPCFSFRNRMFCFLSVDKKSGKPYLLMVEGRQLHHPALQQGKRKRMKVFTVDPHIDLDIDNLEMILNEALNLYRNGLIRTK